MLTRIRNAILVKSRNVKVLRTNLTLRISEILKTEGFIESFEESGEIFLTKNKMIYKYIYITLKYKGVRQTPYITQLKRISKPGLRVYVSCKNIPKVLGGIGVAVFCVSKLTKDLIFNLNSLKFKNLRFS